jgi:hypothetical protein
MHSVRPAARLTSGHTLAGLFFSALFATGLVDHVRATDVAIIAATEFAGLAALALMEHGRVRRRE